ncbi:MAG: RNA-binding cell elongation regulator Jag/EloR [Ilumatobacter sp.]|jgi:spoIIIJ-associated protein|uniref:RNA-binding cell elongation regulator Jag/EloR n=1 Tax=Ilumatobacter sp. TaxID=1967498 RepID=UPI00391D230D
MEWVETTAKSVDDAKSAALDQLGVAADEAEFEIVEEPKQGLFGRTRGEARVRARIKPAQVRPKAERRRKSSKDRTSGATKGSSNEAASSTPAEVGGEEAVTGSTADETTVSNDDASTSRSSARGRGSAKNSGSTAERQRGGGANRSRNNRQEPKMGEEEQSDVSPQEVGDAAVVFMDGLVAAFGAQGTTELEIDETELDVRVSGDGLGLLVGPGGRTLNAIQDLARVSAQRRLGDHETRLRVDVAGYRVRRAEALTRFAGEVAAQVRESGVARSLEPMSSADRKVIHDALNDEDGVGSRSEGDDPNRRVVVVPD